MKKLKKFVSIFTLVLVMLFAASCSTESILNSNNSSSTVYSVDFYKKNGYYELSVCESLSYTLDETCMVQVDGVTLVKKGTVISFSQNSELSNVAISNESYHNFNFETRSILSGYMINGEFYSIDGIGNLKYSIVSDTIINEETKSFEVLGFTIYNVNAKNENSEIFFENEEEFLKSIMLDEVGNISPTQDGYLFYYYGESEENFASQEEGMTKNFYESYVKSNADLTTLYFELPVDNVTSYVFLTVKDEDNEYYFIKLASSDDGSICSETYSNGEEKFLTFDFSLICENLNLIKMNLVLCCDLTTTLNYLK